MSIIIKENHIKVIDSTMGSGKTSWAIQYMDATIDKKFIFITPYLSEIDRVINATTREFTQPESNRYGTKLDSFKELVNQDKNIISTHALFQKCDQELIELIEVNGYTLILDEVINVINDMHYSKDDIQILLNSTNENGEKVITVDIKGFVKWNDESYQEGIFKRIRNQATAGNLMIYKNLAMYWLFPVEVFKAFEEIYILTYMFNGQIQCYYYELFKLDYKLYSVRSDHNNQYQLLTYIKPSKEDRTILKEKIRIYHSKPIDRRDINATGDTTTAYSKSNIETNKSNFQWKKTIKKDSYNFYHHKIKTKSNKVMWTTFKDYENTLAIRGLKKSFVAVNVRATNEYANCNTCIYLANRYMNPMIKQFFNSNGIVVDEDLFALSEMLQWIFRSAIRNGENIDIFIPSIRMRTLLEGYLDNEI